MKSMNPKWLTWLRECSKGGTPADVPKGSLGALTGQDMRALDAIAACWKLLASCDDEGERAVIAAVRALLPAMQPQCRFFARELIAWALDWGHRDKYWPLVQPLDAPPPWKVIEGGPWEKRPRRDGTPSKIGEWFIEPRDYAGATLWSEPYTDRVAAIAATLRADDERKRST